MPDAGHGRAGAARTVKVYSEYSARYFDLVISDECHRSINGKWSGVLKHFDGMQAGLTAMPCIADPSAPADEDDKLAIRDTPSLLLRGQFRQDGRRRGPA